jgi:hypothetical protein
MKIPAGMIPFFIYCFAIRNILKKNNLELNTNNKFEMINKISNILIKGKDSLLKAGICPIIENNKIEECDLTADNNLYKKTNSIIQVINLLKKSIIFVFNRLYMKDIVYVHLLKIIFII